MDTLRWAFPFVILLFLSGCRDFDNIELPTYEAEIAFPLINSDIVVSDLIQQLDSIGFIKVDPDGLIRLEFTGDTIIESAKPFFDSLSNFPDAEIPLLVNPFPINLNALDGVDVDTAFLKTGKLAITELTNPSNNVIDFELQLPQFVRDDQPFSFSARLVPGESFTNPDLPFDLADYAVIPENGIVNIRYIATDSQGNDVSLANDLKVQFSDISFSLIYGTFETLAFETISDSIEVDFFTSFQEGEIAFDDPKAFIDVDNSIGIPSRVTLSSFDVIPAPKPDNPNPAPVPLEPSNLSFDLNFPTQPGTSAFTEITIDKTNSNLDEVLSQVPIRVEYQLDGEINPEGSQFTGYSADTGAIRGIIILNLPLVGSISNYLARDTSSLDLEDVDGAKEGMVRLTIENEIPLALNLTIFFEDFLGNRILQLLPDSPEVAQAAGVDEEGNSISPTSVVTDIPVSEEQLDTIFDATRAILEVRFTTSDFPQAVRITENEKANIKLGLRATITDE